MRAAKAVMTMGLTLGLAMPAGAEEAQPRRLTAATKWRMNYNKDSCLLSRQFGEGKEEVLMLMEQFQPGETFRLTLKGTPVQTSNEAHDIRIRFGPDEDWQTVSHYRGYSRDKRPITFILPTVRMAADPKVDKPAPSNKARAHATMTPEQENRVTAFYFDARRGSRDMTALELGSMGEPMAALRKCMDALVTKWGLQPEEQKQLFRPVVPKTDERKWLNSNDYPMAGLLARKRAIVDYRLMIDAEGKVSGCSIQSTVGGAEFEEVVCDRLLKRASFELALNAEKQPVASFYADTVRFDILN